MLMYVNYEQKSPGVYTTFGHTNLGVFKSNLNKTETTVKHNSSFLIKSTT